MKCPICAENLSPHAQGKVLNKYPAHFDFCNNCGFLRIRDPHWLDESYSDAIAVTDTGLVARNVYFAKRLALLLFLGFGEQGGGKYIDVAGGYGMLVRLMRDYGFDFYWQDKYCQNLLSAGFDHSATNNFAYDAITAVEVMEHLEDPLGFVTAALSEFMSDTFIFTTLLFKGSPPSIDDWPYYSLMTGQHISFFQQQTLNVMAEKMGMRFMTFNGIHIFTKREINLRFANIYCSHRFAVLLADPVLKLSLKSLTLSDSEGMISWLKKTT